MSEIRPEGFEIKVLYKSCDGARDLRKFKTLKGAQKFAHHWVGAHPDIGSSYAVSFDGIGTITPVYGVTLAELFPPKSKPITIEELPGGEMTETTWEEFVRVNDADTIAEVTEGLREARYVEIGGGAQPRVRIIAATMIEIEESREAEMAAAEMGP